MPHFVEKTRRLQNQDGFAGRTEAFSVFAASGLRQGRGEEKPGPQPRPQARPGNAEFNRKWSLGICKGLFAMSQLMCLVYMKACVKAGNGCLCRQVE